MAAEPRWLSWCSNGGDKVKDDEGEGSSDVVVVKMEVAAIGVGQPREAAMEVAVVMTAAAAAMVVWQRGDDYSGGVRATRRGRWW
nr:hypothetical protein [Tanacetum cinerariifolium]